MPTRRAILKLPALAPILAHRPLPVFPNRLLVFDGNELTNHMPAVESYATHVMNAYRCPGVVAAIPGHAMTHLLARFGAYIEPILRGWNGDRIVFIWEAANTLPMASPVDCWGMYADYCARVRATGSQSRVIVGTALPCADFGMDFESARQAFNEIARAHWHEVADGLMDVAADERIGQAVTPEYYLDQINLNDAGQRVVAAIALRVISALFANMPQPALPAPTAQPVCLAFPFVPR